MMIDTPSVEIIPLHTDVKTMPHFAYARLAAGLSFPGVIEIPQAMPVGDAIDQLLMIIGASDSEEWRDRVVHLPL
jgi:hypothetical protein